MKTLKERLADYRIMKKAVSDGEQENGFTVRYDDTDFSFYYKKVDEKLVVLHKEKDAPIRVGYVPG